MATATSPVIEISERDFATAVVQRSAETPVVVDFWAPWCGPCRVLGPVLERLAKEANGAWTLAKINVDQNPRISTQFGVQAIPAVKAFRDGKVVAEFTGALPESQVRTWLKQVAPSEGDQLLAKARQQEASDPAGAAATYRRIVSREPGNTTALLGLGRVLLLLGDPEAEPTLRQIKAGAKEHAAAQSLLDLAPLLSSGVGDPDSVRDRVAADPADVGARWNLAAILATRKQWEDALRHLLVIVERNRDWGDDAARRAMLAIFALLGEEHPLVARYRRQLASAVFG